MPPELAPLLGDDLAAQSETLARLREDPTQARAWLVQALQSSPPPPMRWRLVHRLGEFGEMEDLPLLLTLLQGEGEPMEKRVIRGTLSALYGNPPPTADFSALVQDFSFVQTRAPVRQLQSDQGRYMISAWSIQTLHQEAAPLSLVKKVLPLRGKPFPSRELLEEALKKQLREQEWNQNRDVLLRTVERVPERVKLEGLARVKVFNPLDRPLLIRVALDLWHGRFEQPPVPAWLYLEPGTSAGVDVPVTLQAPLDRAQPRMDLRLSEVNGAMIPSLHKLYLPLQF
jgi:hypothetical protein